MIIGTPGPVTATTDKSFLILQGLMLFPMEYSVDSGFMMDSNGQHSVYRGVRRMAVCPMRDLQESVSGLGKLQTTD